MQENITGLDKSFYFLEKICKKETGDMQKDYVEMQWKILQQKKPVDFINCYWKKVIVSKNL
jgi:GDP-D-mannose dehydratase